MGIRQVLKDLADGKYDGASIDNECNGVSWGFLIHKGTPIQYRRGKDSKYFDGKETIRKEGKYTEKRRFESYADKKSFILRYGYKLYKFPEIVALSKQYYENKDK